MQKISFLFLGLLILGTGCNPFDPFRNSGGGTSICTGSVTLAWEPGRNADNNVDSTVIGYNVYIGAETTSYSQVRDSQTTTPLVGQTYTVTGLEINRTHYFAVTAYNIWGESGFSNEVNATLTACGKNIVINLLWKVKNETKK